MQHLHVRGQPIRAAASDGLNCVVGAAARPITNATVPSMRCVALRLSGARLPAASVRIVVCATHIDRTGLSCTSRPSSNSRSRLANAGDIIFVVWANSWKRSTIMLSVNPARNSDGLKKKVPVPRVIGHPLNIVLTKQVAQRMGDIIVINRATGCELQMTLPVPNIVGGVVGRGLLGEPLLRQPEATVTMPPVALLPDQNES